MKYDLRDLVYLCSFHDKHFVLIGGRAGRSRGRGGGGGGAATRPTDPERARGTGHARGGDHSYTPVVVDA